MELKDYLAIFIPCIVTSIGFIISIIINKQTYSQNIQQLKSEQQISKLYGIQKDVLDYVDMYCISLAYPDKKIAGMENLQNKIRFTVICYGSENAVKLIEYIISMYYTCKDDNIEFPSSKYIAAHILLAMQIKYDTTGIKTSSNVWYIGKYTTQRMIKDYSFYNESVSNINDIVDELKLANFLKIEL